MSVNKVILVGNIGADPELRQTQSGTSVANFNLATSETVKGEKKTEWHRIVTFGRTAENCSEYLHKGSQVCLEGKLQTRKWQDRDGNDRYTTEVVAFSVTFLSNKAGGYKESGSTGGGFGSGYDKPKDPNYDPGPPTITDDDVPF